MFTLLYDRTHRILMAKLAGVFSSEDAQEMDAALIRFMSRAEAPGEIRGIFDYHEVEAMAVPRSRMIERAAQPPIIRSTRVLVAYPNAPEDFGLTFRQLQAQEFNVRVEIVRDPEDAYRVLGIEEPAFEPVQED